MAYAGDSAVRRQERVSIDLSEKAENVARAAPRTTTRIGTGRVSIRVAAEAASKVREPEHAEPAFAPQPRPQLVFELEPCEPVAADPNAYFTETAEDGTPGGVVADDREVERHSAPERVPSDRESPRAL